MKTFLRSVLLALGMLVPAITAAQTQVGMDSQSIDITELRNRLGNYNTLKKDIDGLKSLKSDVARLLEFERTVTRRMGDIYTKAEVEALIKKAREDLTDACRDLNNLLNKRIDDLQKQLDAEKKAREAKDAEHDKSIEEIKTDVQQVKKNQMFARISGVGGVSIDDEQFFLFLIGAGFAKRTETAVFDLESTFGGTQEDDGFLLGLFTDALFGNDTVRGGPGLGVNVNFGNTTAEVIPAGVLEIGPHNLAFMVRPGLPIVVADPDSGGGVDEFRLDLGLVTRF